MAGAHGESWHEWTSSDPNGPLLAIRPGGCGDVTQAHVFWRDPSGGSDVASGVCIKIGCFLFQVVEWWGVGS